MDEVEAGFARFGEIDGGFVGDDLRVCESFGFADGFSDFGWKACFGVVCFCSSVTLSNHGGWQGLRAAPNSMSLGLSMTALEVMTTRRTLGTLLADSSIVIVPLRAGS